MANETSQHLVTFRVDCVRSGEWCVSLNGERAVTFSGPDAEERAERCVEEIRMRVKLSEGGAFRPDTTE